MVSDLAFYIVSVIVVVAAWRVVVTGDVARASLALVVVLAGLAPVYLMLAAEFVAVVQLLVYVGAVVVLLLFAMMLTKRGANDTDNGGDVKQKLLGGVVSASLFVLLCSAFTSGFGNRRVAPEVPQQTSEVGDVLLRQHVVPFEVISVLLLVTLVGAIVVARRD